MTAPITLTGALQGRLHKGSAVLHCGQEFVVCKTPADGGRMYEIGPGFVNSSGAGLEMVLDEKTTRAHAQWWLLAESIRLHKLRYPRLEASVSDWVVLSFHWEMPPRKRLDKWRFRRFTIGRGYIWDSIPTPGRPWEHCPALADLDPSDRTLLADGSRRVVALALQAVCLQMGGGR